MPVQHRPPGPGGGQFMPAGGGRGLSEAAQRHHDARLQQKQESGSRRSTRDLDPSKGGGGRRGAQSGAPKKFIALDVNGRDVRPGDKVIVNDPGSRFHGRTGQAQHGDDRRVAVKFPGEQFHYGVDTRTLIKKVRGETPRLDKAERDD